MAEQQKWPRWKIGYFVFMGALGVLVLLAPLLVVVVAVGALSPF